MCCHHTLSYYSSYVGRVSLVSKTFHSASDLDVVWNHFFHSDSNFMDSIISYSPSSANAPTKKALFLALSKRPIIINNGRKSFQLDRNSRKICYMISARFLTIFWDNHIQHWNYISMPDSRFSGVAEKHPVWWREIRGMINRLALSPNTQYAAYLVFKIIDTYGLNYPVELSISVQGGHRSTKVVCLNPNVERKAHNRVEGLPRPSVRSNGWLEIEMGEFFNSGLENEQVQMSVVEIGFEQKRNLFLEGIEVRPAIT